MNSGSASYTVNELTFTRQANGGVSIDYPGGRVELDETEWARTEASMAPMTIVKRP